MAGEAASRDDRGDLLRQLGSHDQCGSRTGAGTKQACRQAPGSGLSRQPFRGTGQSLTQQWNVEAILPCNTVNPVFAGREQIKQQGSQACVSQVLCNRIVASAEAAAATTVGEGDDASRIGRNLQPSL